MASPPIPDEKVPRIEGYQLGECMGRGAFGVVYLPDDPDIASSLRRVKDGLEHRVDLRSDRALAPSRTALLTALGRIEIERKGRRRPPR